ncbi:MAG: hypothetical protein K2I30_05555 [Clostridia bacterium]|nr:hypothetical protein [Clostridia bacterium]
MRKAIDVKELFNRLCGFEYDLLKRINKDHGEEFAPLNFTELAATLKADKSKVRRAIKRLVGSNVLIADGENFKINWEVFKAPEGE